jgi:hypothetical protein
MRLSAFVIDGHEVDIRPAPPERPWMDGTNDHFAYRCLPLTMANSYGWEILNPCNVVAHWNGGAGASSLLLFTESGTHPLAASHFGHGILTFNIPCLFRTDPGIDLLVQGPINRPKDAIAPLTGIVETGWSPYTFTMNWKFTRSAISVRFEKGEPLCHIWPIRRGALDAVEPEMHRLSDAPELRKSYEQWRASRNAFNQELLEPDSAARSERWQKRYHRGLMPDGTKADADHRSRIQLKPFRTS